MNKARSEPKSKLLQSISSICFPWQFMLGEDPGVKTKEKGDLVTQDPFCYLILTEGYR